MDALTLRGAELWLNVGCTAAERGWPQRVELDLRLTLPLGPAGKKDDLTLTVDYADALRKLRARLSKKKYRLIEAVAEDAAAWALLHTPATAVAVTVRKRALPGLGEAEVYVER